MTDEEIKKAVREYLDSRPTLRDQFAMAALTGLLSDPERDAEPSEYAECAYEYADAMLAAREEKK